MASPIEGETVPEEAGERPQVAARQIGMQPARDGVDADRIDGERPVRRVEAPRPILQEGELEARESGWRWAWQLA